MSSSGRERPWDRKRKVVHPPPTSNDTLPRTDDCVQVLDGRKYYSDRFYLNDCDDKNVEAIRAASEPGCTCGASQPPPLFSSSLLVESLDLRAAVLGTFSLDVPSMASQFPSLFSGDVPCIVMHGKKGWTPPETTAENTEVDDNSDVDSIMGDCQEFHTEGGCGLKSLSKIPENVHFTEITPTWLPQLPNSLRDVVCPTTGTLDHRIVAQRVSKRGVHHPKFMILFEKKGSVVVIVGTANLTSSGFSTDASWVQRFHPFVSETQQAPSTTDSSSFGLILANFLQCQTLATAAGQLTVHAFFRRYLGFKSLKALPQKFDFSTAVVSLVATVPGDYHETKIDYGMQRVSHVVGSMPWALKHPKKDRLILQPTSFGSEWEDRNLVDLARCYLETKNEKSVLQRLDIFWPTSYFIRRARKRAVWTNEELTFEPKQPGPAQTTTEDGGFLFLSSESFNRIGVDCLSRMSMYEPSDQQGKVLVPHFKSVVRVFEGSDYQIRKDYRMPKCENYFSWFLLTSACLSRGAQGERNNDIVSYSNFELGVLFTTRLGGSRCSDNRMYCFQPSRCACGANGSSNKPSAQLIHLPCPYLFHPPAYVENANEEISFRETPYFHEIPDGTGCIGNMKLTPLGKALASKYT